MAPQKGPLFNFYRHMAANPSMPFLKSTDSTAATRGIWAVIWIAVKSISMNFTGGAIFHRASVFSNR
jgi:hypothetical protein